VLGAGEIPNRSTWSPGSDPTYYSLPLDDGLFGTRWDLHPGSHHTPGPNRDGTDCTHYCWVPTLWHVVWEQLALVLEHHSHLSRLKQAHRDSAARAQPPNSADAFNAAEEAARSKAAAEKAAAASAQWNSSAVTHKLCAHLANDGRWTHREAVAARNGTLEGQPMPTLEDWQWSAESVALCGTRLFSQKCGAEIPPSPLFCQSLPFVQIVPSVFPNRTPHPPPRPNPLRAQSRTPSKRRFVFAGRGGGGGEATRAKAQPGCAAGGDAI